jgi:IS30 family transposase
MDERTFIQLGLMMALKPAQIALELSRSTSTITRELQRNGWIRPVKLRGRGRPAHSGCYQSVAAPQAVTTREVNLITKSSVLSMAKRLFSR